MKKPVSPHWIKHSHLFGADEYECSQCGALFKSKSSVCPNCGMALRLVFDDQEWIDEAEEIHIMLDK